jgi:phage-related protein
MATFSPPKAPSYDATKTTRTRILRAQFGDGYSQRAGDGLHGVPVEFSLTWPGLTTAEADTVETFFEARGGYESFDYTLPRESSARKFICREWTRSAVAPGHDAIRTKFEEVFDL